jgi:hypothetical protein
MADEVVIDKVPNFGLVRIKANFNFTAAVTANILLETGDGGDLLSISAVEDEFNLTIFRYAIDVNGDADPNGFLTSHDDPNREIIRVTAFSGGDTLTTISRAQEGTSAKSHNVTDARYLGVVGFTKKTRDDINARLAKVGLCAFRAHLSLDQAIAASSSETQLQVDTEDYDEASNFDPVTYRFSAPRPMLLQVVAAVRWAALAATAGTTLDLFIRKNGTKYTRGTERQPSNTSAMQTKVIDQIPLTTNDYVDISAEQSHSAARNVDEDSGLGTYFWGRETLRK